MNQTKNSNHKTTEIYCPTCHYYRPMYEKLDDEGVHITCDGGESYAINLQEKAIAEAENRCIHGLEDHC